jgi:hypothetical protein
MPRLSGNSSRAASIRCPSTNRIVAIPSGAVSVHVSDPELADVRPMLDGMVASGLLSYGVANDSDSPPLSSRVFSIATPAAKGASNVHAAYAGDAGRATLDLSTKAAGHLNTVVEAKTSGAAGNAVMVAAVGDSSLLAKASLACATKADGKLNTVVQAKAAGTGGNAITVTLVGDGAPASGVVIAEVGNLVTIHYEDNVSTVTLIEAAITSTSTLIEVKTAGTGATKPRTPASDFVAAPLAGGTNHGGVTISEAGAAVTIHYESGVSTVAQVETAITASSTQVAVLTAGTAGTVLTAPTDSFSAAALAGGSDSGSIFPGPFTNPDVPRNARVTMASGYDGGDVILAGTRFGAPVQETFAAGSGVVRVGAQVFDAFAGARKASIGSAAATVSIGTGDKLGLAGALRDAAVVAFVDGTFEAPTVDAAMGAITPTTVPNGSHSYLVIGNV